MKKLTPKYKEITKILLAIGVFVLISFLSTILLNLFGVIYYDDGIKLNQKLFASFTNTWYGFIIIILIQVAITSLLSFIPGSSMAFILLLQALYPNPAMAFVLAFTGVLLSSLMMYVIGRYGGYSICKRMIGEEDCKKASELLNHKGKIYFPMMMLFPIFPDDALVMVAGTLKMSLNWFIPSIVIGRGIGVATITFGISIVPFDKFTSPWHWILFVLSCLVLIALVFLLARALNRHMDRKKKEHQLERSEEFQSRQ